MSLARPECNGGRSSGVGFDMELGSPNAGSSRETAERPVAAAPGAAVEVFGIPLGQSLGWAACRESALGVASMNRPCVDVSLARGGNGSVYFMFNQSTAPTMLHWGAGGERMGYLIDGRLERMTFRIHREDEHLQAFEQKFGAPKKELVPMHNNQGGQWTGFIHRWDIAGTVIKVDCTRFERVCSVEIETPVWRQQRQQDKAGRQKL